MAQKRKQAMEPEIELPPLMVAKGHKEKIAEVGAAAALAGFDLKGVLDPIADKNDKKYAEVSLAAAYDQDKKDGDAGFQTLKAMADVLDEARKKGVHDLRQTFVVLGQLSMRDPEGMGPAIRDLAKRLK